jgi:aldehyde:ferredoxin oxidoreductase
MNGYHDRLAWIDLTRGTVEYREIGSQDLNNFIGGSNLGAAILARLVGPDTDPLGPDNPLIILTGPYTSAGVPGGNRHEVIALSPLSGIFCESSAGGAFGRVLKLTGLDGMVITGASSKPVMLVLDDDEIRIVDAERLWGKDIFECDDLLKEEYGRKFASAVIGPAGERLIPMAVIAHDGRHTRVAGRGGMGAVMGSKKLKAIVIPKPGVKQPEYSDPKGLAETLKTDTAAMKESLEMFSKFGTPGSFTNNERLGNLPINNWRDARATDLQGKINGFVMADTIQVKRAGCKRCPFLCGRVVEVDDAPYTTDGVVEAPEYETLGTLGSMQLVDDLKGIAKANELCNRYGLDTITLGGTLAFANECFEKGLLTLADTDGLELGMGRPDSNIEMIRRIALQEGDLGKLLSMGSRYAAKEIGKGAEEYTVEVKGFELAMHDPRFSWGQALSYATANRGACHLATIAHAYELVVTFPEIGLNEPAQGRVREGKADLVVNLQNFQNMRDSLIFCNFDQLNNAAKATTFINWYNLITGNGMTFDSFMQAGERGFQLKRMINNRRGITRKDDTLPLRIQTLKKVGTDIDFDVPPVNQMLSDYYDIRGWSEEGRLTTETVKKNGLTDFTAA